MKNIIFFPLCSILLSVFSISCQKVSTESSPKIVSNSQSYYYTKLQAVKSATIYETTPPGSLSYKVNKGSLLTVGLPVTLSLNGSSSPITAINTTNSNYDIISVGSTIGGVNAGGTLFNRTDFRTVYNGLQLRINVVAIPTDLCEGKSYVANIAEIENCGNPTSIEQQENVFVIDMTYPSLVYTGVLRDSLNSWRSAWATYANSLNSSNPLSVPIWSNYMKYNWYKSPTVQSFKGKFIIRTTGTNQYGLYIAEPEYPASTCLTIVEE